MFNFKDVVTTKLSSHIVVMCSCCNAVVMSHIMCSCCNATYYDQTQIHFFVRAPEHLGITPLIGKFVKPPKKSTIFDQMLLDSHKASFDNFSILLKEGNPFKWQLKESLVISRDKPILNKNVLLSLGTVWLIMTLLYDIYYFCNPMSIHHFYIKFKSLWNCHSLIIFLVEGKAYLWL